MKTHHLKLSDRFCATRLKHIECPYCNYLAIAKVDGVGRIIDKQKIKDGQRGVMHIYTENQDTQKV